LTSELENELIFCLLKEGNSAGSNQLQVKWYSNPSKPLKPNGHIQYSVYANGPFLIELNKTDTINYKKQNKSFIKIDTLNLFNTTILNTRYGIIDKILPYSNYSLQINASNTKGFILSNIIILQTFKSIPDFVVPPQVVNARSNSLQIEWYDPILINSDDKIFYFLVDYRVKYIWNENGSIDNSKYESQIFSLFSSKTLTKTFTLNGLKPFTAFSFQVTVINSYGQSKSEYSDDYYTREETPRFQDEPTILNFTSDTVLISWQPPKMPNGIIKNYILHALKFTEDDLLGNSLTISQNVTLKSSSNSYLFVNLEPYTFYLFDVDACNSQG
jgi:usherin